MSSNAIRRISRTLGACVLLAASALPASADEVRFAAPLAAGATASDEATLASPPSRIEIPPGQKKVTAMGTAAPGRPAEFLLEPPAGAMLSIGVASKSGEARLALYPEGKEKALAGTEESAGAIRWIGSFDAPGALRIVAHTQGAETPVRVEISVEATAEDRDPAE